ncbi:MAG TPA: response regulator, partial [Salinarimonas sp.]|nr:response regulator [Salinarimonas sp.]
VVDDEAFIREALCRTLIDEGFGVIEAASGADALCVLNACQPFDALVTDVRLGPGPDGWAVARAARQVRPLCPVIYMSGYTPGEMDKVPRSVFLDKSLRPSELCWALTQLIRIGALRCSVRAEAEQGHG